MHISKERSGIRMFVWLWMGCSESVLDETEPQSPVGYLKIEEVYYAGSVPVEGIDRYYADQFIQLRNTSDDTLDIGGVGIGDLFGLAGAINSGYGPNAFASDSENLYFANLWQFQWILHIDTSPPKDASKSFKMPQIILPILRCLTLTHILKPLWRIVRKIKMTQSSKT